MPYILQSRTLFDQTVTYDTKAGAMAAAQKIAAQTPGITVNIGLLIGTVSQPVPVTPPPVVDDFETAATQAAQQAQAPTF